VNEVTEQLAGTLRWMIADMNHRREDTGLVDVPLSPEMQLAQDLLNDLDAGRIECQRKGE